MIKAKRTESMNRYLLGFVVGFLAAVIMLAGIQGPLYAGEAGEEAAEFLRLGAGAKHAAMGGAAVAGVEGPSAVHFNPAGISRRDNRSFEFTYQQMVEDINYGNLGYTQPFGEAHVGVGVGYVGYGSEDVTEFEDNILREMGSSFSGSDIVGGVSYSRRWGDFSAGMTAKAIRLEIDDSIANAQAIDLGLQWRPETAGWFNYEAGAVLANLSSRVDGEEDGESDGLPRLLKGGLRLMPGLGLKVDLDVEHRLVSHQTDIMGGVEWNATPNFALRAGYNASQDVDDGISAGIGVRLARMSLDYAFVPFGEFGDLHRVSFGYSFGE